MQNDHLYTTGSSVYPGEYVPLFKENDFNKTIKHSSKNKANDLLVNIEEMANCYKIQFAVPGVKRENFLINSYGNILSISVIHDDCALDKQGSFQLHEFNYGYCSNRKILLADNADPVFISAEYKAGVLRLYIPKSEHPLKWMNTKIAVY